MNLKQQVCSLDLAKRLKELGVKQESHFHWIKNRDGNYYIKDEAHPVTWGGIVDHAVASAFTVAELGEMLPRYLQVNGYSLELTIVRSSVWRFYYGPTGELGGIFLTTGNDDTEADARAKMLIHLIENKLLTT